MQKTALIRFFEFDFNEVLNGPPTAGGRPSLCWSKTASKKQMRPKIRVSESSAAE